MSSPTSSNWSTPYLSEPDELVPVVGVLQLLGHVLHPQEGRTVLGPRLLQTVDRHVEVAHGAVPKHQELAAHPQEGGDQVKPMNTHKWMKCKNKG